MQREQFYVVKHDGEWKIKHNGEHSKVYGSQARAIEDARSQAQAFSKSGKPSQVLVQAENNTFREEWSYGTDPYPPKG